MNPRRGFTLVELLAVIAVIGVLVALMLPAVQAARAAARRSQCRSNLRQLGIALYNYHDAQGVFPASHDMNWWSWIAHSLPYLEEDPLQKQVDFAKYAFPENPFDVQPAVSAPLPILQCASDDRAGRQSTSVPGAPFAYTSYLGNSGTQGGVDQADLVSNGVFRSPLDFPGEMASLPIAKVTDGTSKTLLLGERPIIEWENSGGDFGWWAAGAGLFWGPPGRGDNVLDSSVGLRPGTPSADSLDDIFHWWSYHPGGAHFVFVDGSARLLSYDIDHNTLLALTSRNGGEAAHLDN